MARFDLLTRQYDFMSMNNSANQAIGDVLSLCYSSDSTFYLGASSGMTRMKCDQAGTCEFWQYDRSDGISNDMIHGILEDKDKCIWLSSNFRRRLLEMPLYRTSVFRGRRWAGMDRPAKRPAGKL